MEATQRSQPPHNIALLPPPIFLGHLIPFIELAKKLVFHHNCTITLIILDDGSSMKSQKSLLQGLPTTINTVFLPPASTDDLPENARVELLVSVRLTRSFPALRDTLTSLKQLGTPATALVVDLFAIDAIDIAKQFEIPAYLFHVIATNELSLSVLMPKLDESCTSEYRDMEEPITLPGSIVLSPEDLPDSMKERNSEVHKWALDWCNKFLEADGVMVNSFLELELEAFKDLEQRRPDVPPVYPVGPLIRTGTEAESDRGSECVKWLNDQPPKSVLFVSFGSGGTLSVEQFNELALGLEMSGHRFLWVVRTPQENIADAYLNSQSIVKDPLDFLPDGFLERTKGRGLVVASWAPQIQVLSHRSTGGFVTHCGWNSILESAVFGVPMIAWPLCFEHRMNAVFLTDGLKGAIRVKENENGVVGREQIAQLMKRLMQGEEGKQIRNRMNDVKIAAGNALSQEGSSTQALAHVVQQWINWK
ncbi:hydroquinone glucosyltransferase-like [Sesamum indicum]|uniref:Glycosyltransferase n=1 Tax=Sesamum indicum TaxID=4182 RepID=A0A6I9U3B3_SESIN|nr:hydroquinone glucosyltransferase-like [Sesamum indicum]